MASEDFGRIRVPKSDKNASVERVRLYLCLCAVGRFCTRLLRRLNVYARKRRTIGHATGKWQLFVCKRMDIHNCCDEIASVTRALRRPLLRFSCGRGRGRSSLVKFKSLPTRSQMSQRLRRRQQAHSYWTQPATHNTAQK